MSTVQALDSVLPLSASADDAFVLLVTLALGLALAPGNLDCTVLDKAWPNLEGGASSFFSDLEAFEDKVFCFFAGGVLTSSAPEAALAGATHLVLACLGAICTTRDTGWKLACTKLDPRMVI